MGPAPSTVASVIDRRRVIAASGALGIASLVLPTASAAASVELTVLGCSDSPWSVIPFLTQGSAVIVGGVTVRAIENSAVEGYDGDVYLHQSNLRIRTVLTFSAPVPELQVMTEAHADGISERYDFTFLRSSSQVDTEFIQNEDVTRSYVVAGGFDRLEIDYTYPDGAGEFGYGSFLTLWIPCE